MKKAFRLLIALALCLCICLSLASCLFEDDTPAETQSESEGAPTIAPPTTTEDEYDYALRFFDDGEDYGVELDSSVVSAKDKVYTIHEPGIYLITGYMPDGQIRVEVDKTEQVTLLLDNFVGACSSSAVIYVVSADKVEIDLQRSSVNRLTDSQNYVFENPGDDKPNACIYSSEDLTIKGGGILYVEARYNNGIGCKNDLEIKNGSVYISAVKNALKGNDSVTICGDAEIIVTAANDAIKSDTLASEKPGKGFIMITEEASVSISCEDEAIQATQNITVTSGATVKIVKAKNVYKCDGDTSIDEGCITVQP